MTVREALAEATLYIPRRDAELLLAHVAGRPRTWVLSYPEADFAATRAEEFTALVRRRDAGEPLQYLLGRQEFFGLRLRVTPDVLIPRPETEHLVEAVLDFLVSSGPSATRELRIVDVGTGSGAIALALAARLPRGPETKITALDVSRAALAVAHENADQLGLAAHVRFLHSDLLAAVQKDIAADRLFDVVVSNPPYVALADSASMQREVVEHEPHVALFAGADGLDVYRRLIPQAHEALRPGGLLALEFGFGQSHALASLLGSGWAGVRFLRDYAGIERVALAEKI
jgi:release factor glutamine methyltransferase